MIEIPTVSILVPTYRHVSFIGDCLDSILQQSLIEECEVLVGEDGSDDGTREICMRYMNAHPGRIRLFLNDRSRVIQVNGVPTGRRNLMDLIVAARGRYLAFCEGDDRWCDPGKLERQVMLLEKHPEAVGSYHSTEVIDELGNSEGQAFREPLPGIYDTSNIASTLSPFHTSSLVCRPIADLIDPPRWTWSVGSFDMALFGLLACQGPLLLSDGRMSAYRKHGTGITRHVFHRGMAMHVQRMVIWARLGGYCSGWPTSSLEGALREHIGQVEREGGRRLAIRVWANALWKAAPHSLMRPLMQARLLLRACRGR